MTSSFSKLLQTALVFVHPCHYVAQRLGDALSYTCVQNVVYTHTHTRTRKRTLPFMRACMEATEQMPTDLPYITPAREGGKRVSFAPYMGTGRGWLSRESVGGYRQIENFVSLSRKKDPSDRAAWPFSSPSLGTHFALHPA